jgi:hypothetical protein
MMVKNAVRIRCKNNLLLAICCVLITVSCNQKSNRNANVKNDAIVVDSKTITQSKDVSSASLRKEKFDEFLDQFNKDFKFQKNRVLFPLRSTILANQETEEYDTVYIQSANYQKHELTFPKSNVVDGDVILRSESISDSQHQLTMLVEDTGIRIEFIFYMKENLWYLCEIRNRST